MKNRKRISVLLVLAMVMTLLTGLAAPAAASTAPFNIFSSGFNTVRVGSNQTGGTITAAEREDASWGAPVERVHVLVRLPEGVTFNNRPTYTNFGQYVTSINATGLRFEEASDSMLRVSVVSSIYRDSVTFGFATENFSRLNIATAVTGDIRAAVEVYGLAAGGAVRWIESDTRTIARVAPRAVTVTAAAARLVQMGNNRTAATITIQEGAAASLLVAERVYLDILTEGVTFFAAPGVTGSPTGLTGTAVLDGTRSATFTVEAPTNVFAGRIEIFPVLNVSPGVTGDITVRVRSVTADTVLPTTTVTVATVGVTAVEVTGAANTGGTIFAGRPAGLVQVTEGTARFNLRATGGAALPQPRIVVLALSNARFADGVQFVVDSRVGTAGWTENRTVTINRFNDNRSAWFETGDWGGATELRIRDFRVVADAGAEAGDIRVAVSGTLGATDNVVIGRIARPVSASGISVNLAYPGLDQAAGDITITEAARGTLFMGEYRLELPEGLAFNNTTVRPRIRVATGDIRVSETLTVDGRQLRFTVTGTSSVASAIYIDRLHYDVHRAAMEGNITVRVRAHNNANWADPNAILATAVNARVGAPVPPVPPVPVRPTSVFTIGALSFVRDGVTTAIDAAPTVREGRTLLPLRFAALAVGVSEDDIIWDPARRTVTLFRGDRVVQLRIGDKNMTINGVVVPMDVAASIEGGRTVLPIRFVALALRATVAWDATARTVTVTAQ
jgi:hypothetical protein